MNTNNLKIIKLINGDELFAEVLQDQDSFIVVKNPVRVVVMPTKANPQTPTVGFAPWAEFSSEKNFTIHKAHVIVTMKPVSEFVEQYKMMFSNIVTPKSNLILP